MRAREAADADPEGYPHRVTIYEGLGHWMDRRDAEALPWMASRPATRGPTGSSGTRTT
jgi:hypothetical protein